MYSCYTVLFIYILLSIFIVIMSLVANVNSRQFHPPMELAFPKRVFDSERKEEGQIGVLDIYISMVANCITISLAFCHVCLKAYKAESFLSRIK